MNIVDRGKILNNILQLIELTDYTQMKEACLRKEILFDPMIEKIERDPNPNERHKKLWEKLTHRGPQAFDKILDALKEYHFNEALNILKPQSVYRQSVLSISGSRHGASNRQDPLEPEAPPANANGCANIQNQALQTEGNRISTSSKTFRYCTLTPHSEEVRFSDANLTVKKSSKDGKHPLLETYPMRSKNRGILLLVNILNFVNKKDYRSGSENDSRDMIALFKEMGFTVYFYQDISAVDLRQIIQELIKSKSLRKADCFVLCVMSHGTINKDSLITQIEFKDGSYESTENIVSKFANNVCHDLVNKPKIFIFPVCRGDVPDKEHLIFRGKGEIHMDGPSEYLAREASVPTFSDILICYATVPGYKVHRQSEAGSWYIQELVKTFAHYAFDYPIEDLMKMVDFEVLRIRHSQGYLQTAAYENRGFSKALYFNPGFYP